MSYSILPLPKTALEIMNFGERNNARLLTAIEEGMASGKFTHAIDALIEDDADFENNFDAIAYWIAKTIKPTEKPMLGSNSEETLAPFKKSHLTFPTDGIDVERKISFSALGDLMATPNIECSKDKVYEDVADIIFGSDIIHSNLESTLTKGEICRLSLSDASPEINMAKVQYDSVIAHKGRQYDVLTLANNHILDHGEEGVKTTTAQLEKDGIYYLGINKTAEDVKLPRITQLAGLKVGWVAHTFCVNDKAIPEDRQYLVNVTPFLLDENVDLAPILDQIKALKEQKCDLIVASLHWGAEHEAYPRDEQCAWAREMAEAGADVIIGHHNHVPQHYEVIHPQNAPQKSVPVLYGLGNFLPLMCNYDNVLSLVLRLQIVEGTKNGERAVAVSEMRVIPVAVVQDDEGAVRALKLTTLVAEEKTPEFAAYVQEICDYADSIMGSDWRENA